MFCNFDEMNDGDVIEADICIVGSGAAGISLASEFLDSSYEVILLEGGDTDYNEAKQKNYECDVAGLKHNVNETRGYIFGGTTTMWPGQASPFMEIDFEERDWVDHSGWPLRYSDLKSYFLRAEKKMNIPHSSYDENSWPKAGTKPPQFDQEKLTNIFSQFSPTANFAREYGGQIKNSMNVHLVVNAHTVSIRTNDSSSEVDFLNLKSITGKSGKAKAKYYIICAGGIDTTRLLLASTDVDSRGVGNQNDLVGRYFQEHIHAISAEIKPTDRETFIKQYAPFYDGPIKICPKIAVTSELQVKDKLLNIAGDIVFQAPKDSAVDAAKLIYKSFHKKQLRKQIPQALKDIARNPVEVFKAVFNYYVLNRTVSNKEGPIYLGIQCESEPYSESRIRLSEEKDLFGMPKAVLDWQLSGKEKRTIEVFIQTLKEEFARLGLGDVDESSFVIPEDPRQMDEVLFDAAHHMGSTRMHEDPERGVVNSSCQVHGVHNLYIGSCSVMPTAGFSNPTFNMIALCMKIADEIKDKIKD